MISFPNEAFFYDDLYTLYYLVDLSWHSVEEAVMPRRV